jgi:hypothetical protein
MNRARVIVKEISIQKKGEVHFFQIRLPKNVIRIRGIEYDAFMLSALPVAPVEPHDPVNPDGTVSEPQRTTFLKWTSYINPILGKLKLQNLDRSNIFFDHWIAFQHYASGMPDMSFGLFQKNPYTLNQNPIPKNINLQCSNHLVNGMYEDNIGLRQNADLSYKVKVFVWIETAEDAMGVKYDFQETGSNKELQIKV